MVGRVGFRRNPALDARSARLRQRAPGLPEQDRRHEEERSEAGERDGDLHHLMLRDEARRKLGEDLLELIRRLGRVVFAPGRLSDPLQRRLVDRAAEAATTAAASGTRESAAESTEAAGVAAACWFATDELLAAAEVRVARVVRPEADRVDADPTVGGLTGGLERIGAGVARAV